MTSLPALLGSRRFRPFFVCQFLGAFNDNLYKNGMVVMLTFQAAGWTELSPGLIANLAAGLFILPFFLFSALAGQLADKVDKTVLARVVKVIEILVMLVALGGFIAQSLAALLGALFLLGAHSTLFGPVKYALLPQHLHPPELMAGNALVEAGTFVAILAGTLAGGLLAAGNAAHLGIPVAGLVVALAGYAAARRIPAAPAPVPNLVLRLNPFASTAQVLRFARRDTTVFAAILAISWFWLYGALFLAQFPAYAKDVLGGGETAVTLLLAIFTLGIGGGSILCDRLSSGRVERGLVSLGALGLTLFGLDVAFASPPSILGQGGAAAPLGELLSRPEVWRILLDLFGIGIFGGLYVVPLYALVQSWSDITERARVIAATNILNALYMVVGALVAAALLSAGASIPTLFGTAALVNAGLALLLLRRHLNFLLATQSWLRRVATVRVTYNGLEHLPVSGPALLLGHREAAADLPLILAAGQRPIEWVPESGPRLQAALAAGRLVVHCPAAPQGSNDILSAKERIWHSLAQMPVPLLLVSTSTEPTAPHTRRKILMTISPALAPTPASPAELDSVMAAPGSPS
ncbi:MAG: MFS transporter [Zoogloeaceae bacterium]|nr:MFS transporter [Zoogloeaceae bacterium]